MQRKGTTQEVETVDAKDVRGALATAKTLASEDEKVLRMRYGARLAAQGSLARHGQTHEELQDELLLMEMEALRAWRLHQAQKSTPRPSRTKDKIVRALRKKR